MFFFASLTSSGLKLLDKTGMVRESILHTVTDAPDNALGESKWIKPARWYQSDFHAVHIEANIIEFFQIIQSEGNNFRIEHFAEFASGLLNNVDSLRLFLVVAETKMTGELRGSTGWGQEFSQIEYLVMQGFA